MSWSRETNLSAEQDPTIINGSVFGTNAVERTVYILSVLFAVIIYSFTSRFLAIVVVQAAGVGLM